MTNPAAGPLAGIGVLVTRPARQAAALARRIAELGGTPVLFPALAIEPLAVAPLHLADADIAVFVSANAVEYAAPAIRECGGLPSVTRIAAIGPATAASLAEAGLSAAATLLPGAGADSEALLERLPAADVSGRRVVIFRGHGGRELLGETLRARGARVDYVETYRRTRPPGNLGDLVPGWEAGRIGASLATSAEIASNLFAMAGSALRQLKRTPMIVPHPRVATAAFRLGAETLLVAGPGDGALADGLVTWFGRQRPGPAPRLRT